VIIINHHESPCLYNLFFLHQTLAEYYQARLKVSWLKDTDKAGRELKSAVSNLERGIAWAAGEIEDKNVRVIEESRNLGERLAKGAQWTP